ncbi:MAG: serine/threonine protein kinase [Bradymonadales bacterium]|nr:serine/threonine protein kinase [Bradymonadales bacterium]
MTDPGASAVFDGPLIAGRYRLGRLIGKGSQGATYLAKDIEGEGLVAVKEFNLAEAVDWKQFELFQRECALLQQLDHPGIPKYLDQFRNQDDTRHYLVMEFIDGESLKEIARRRGPLGERELWRILIQVIGLLAYLHSQDPPIIHRDIKPGNLIQRANGEIYLVDFGGARKALKRAGGSTVVGTFGYMAPEQLHGQATPATDLYALGTTLLNLGTGIEPEDFPRKGLRIDFSPLLEVSPQLEKLLQDLLEPDPDHRPPSAIEVQELMWPEEREDGEDGKSAGKRAKERASPSGSTVSPPSVSIERQEELLDPFPRLAARIPEWLALFAGVLFVLLGFTVRMVLWGTARILVPLVFALLWLFVPPSRRGSLRQDRSHLQKSLLDARPFFRDVTRQGKIELKRGQAWWDSRPPSPPRPPPPPPPPPRQPPSRTWTDQRWPWQQQRGPGQPTRRESRWQRQPGPHTAPTRRRGSKRHLEVHQGQGRGRGRGRR